jgi:hypothetical protein
VGAIARNRLVREVAITDPEETAFLCCYEVQAS